MVVNIHKILSVFSDEEGNFLLPVSPGDSVKFSSNYHHEKVMVILPEAIESGLVVELRSKDIELEEVVVDRRLIPKQFEPVKYSENLNTIIKEDREKNPEKYARAGAQYGVNFVTIVNHILGWLKGNEKKEFKKKEYLSSEDLEEAFQQHPLVNKSFLAEQLQISSERYHLFCEYLEIQKLDSELLEPDRKLQLLEVVLDNAAKFQTLSQE